MPTEQQPTDKKLDRHIQSIDEKMEWTLFIITLLGLLITAVLELLTW